MRFLKRQAMILPIIAFDYPSLSIFYQVFEVLLDIKPILEPRETPLSECQFGSLYQISGYTASAARQLLDHDKSHGP